MITKEAVMFITDDERLSGSTEGWILKTMGNV